MLKNDLERMDIEFKDSDVILGKNLLTNANYLNSSRSLMLGNQLDQVVPLEHTEIPLYYTNYEYIVGKYSSSYFKSDSNFKVIHKISKFPSKPNAIYILVVYNNDTGMYDVIERKPGERLTETYGYKYNNDIIDSIEENDVIKKNDVLYHSTSFNNKLQYGFGVNAVTMYTTDPMTIEDAIVISKSLANKLTSVEYDIVRIPLNDNDILINYMGDRHKYKAFPDIGDSVKNSIIAVRRRIAYSQALFDLKEENMRKILTTDTEYYVPFAMDTVVDINVYCNKDEDQLNRNKYNEQIMNYYDNEQDYYKQIVEVLEPIIEKGNYTDELGFIYTNAKKIINPNIKWKDDSNKVFGNIILEFVVEKKVPVVVGSKLSGRQGDKGIISEIRDDDKMPITEHGVRVEQIVNILGVGNRLNPAQLNEIEGNFISGEIIRKINATDSMELKEWLLFEYLNTIVKGYGDKVKRWYDDLSDVDREGFFENFKHGGKIYLEEPPMYGNTGILDFEEVYDKFKIKPVNVYVEKFGRMIKLLKPFIVAEKYIIKLKHH